MKIVIAGGTGFLGKTLARALAADGREVVILTRRPSAPATPEARFVTWLPGSAAGAWAAEIAGAGAVVNLAGESIAARRWSNAQKQRILDSRVQATRSLGEAVRSAAVPPLAFVSGSAVGYY
jgi:NAD dependent epimerase/dehydratase family enzyme